jgi:hypothetical protein
MKLPLVTLTATLALHAFPNDVALLLKKHAGFTDEQIAAVRRGQRVVRAIPTARQEEVAFAGATRLPISVAGYLARLRAGTLYRPGQNVIQIGRFSETPALADLKNFEYEHKKELISRIADYEQRGSRGVPWEAAYLSDRMPAAYEYLLRYPHVRAKGLDDFFMWTQLTFGLRPLTRVAQVSIWQDKQEAIVVTKQIYADRYFDASFQIDHLVSDGTGLYLITLNYGRSELLDGISGKLIRPVVVSRTLTLAEETLDQAKKDLQTL